MFENKVSEEFLSLEQEFNYLLEQIKNKVRQQEQSDEYKKQIQECQKCIKLMEAEIATMSQITKRTYQQQIIEMKKQIVQVEDNVNQLLVHSKKVENLKGNLFENYTIIEEIDKLTQETQQIATNVDNKMASGSQALQGAKVIKQGVKSNLRKTDFTITMMNNKITMDKVSLFIIIILLGIIDVFAIYKKFF